MAKVILKKSSVQSKVPLTGDLDYGELALNYADGIVYYKASDGTIKSLGGSSGSGSSNSVTTFSRKKYTASAGDTTFLVTYSVSGITSYVQVYINGFLIDETEYTATNGTSITLTQACYAGDVVECFGFTGAAPAAAVDTISPFLLMGV